MLLSSWNSYLSFHIFVSTQAYISSIDTARNYYLALKFTSAAYVILQVVYGAQMTSNQQEGEKDNMLLFREQWVLLFSKSKMAEFFFNQSGAQLRIQDGGICSDTLETRPQVPVGVCFWQENSPPDAEAWERYHGFPWWLILCPIHTKA